MMVGSPYQKYLDLRKEYGVFTYESFHCKATGEGVEVRFLFRAGRDLVFRPRLFFHLPGLPPERLTDPVIQSLAFHVGMVEMISCWKAFCSPVIHIEPCLLESGQQQWWKKLFRLGLAEFFHTNGIPQPGEDIFDFSFGPAAAPLPGPAAGSDAPSRVSAAGYDALSAVSAAGYDAPSTSPVDTFGKPAPEAGGIMVPVGGGKDSVVTLETLVREGFPVRAMVINQRGATREVLRAAGLTAESVVEVDRTIDPLLLELNARGFLNGHTPFSAMLAFVSTMAARLSGDRYIVLSNESSASEATIPGTSINHQYSKSLEFESDFREYARQYLGPFPEYFSFLRPLNELQIAALFSRMTNYHGGFKSCNAGSKTDTWCRKCSKCLFTYIMLAPFLGHRQLVEIFGDDLLQDEGLKEQLDQLTGLSDSKPFDCVGTITEVNAALAFMVRLSEKHGHALPSLLRHYREGGAYDPSTGHTREKGQIFRHLLDAFATPHHLPRAFEKLLRRQAETIGGQTGTSKGQAGSTKGQADPHILDRFFKGKKVALLGFGQEGQSSFRTLKRHLPGLSLSVCDKNPALEGLREAFDPRGDAGWHMGPAYLGGLSQADIIIRSPGIPLRELEPLKLRGRVTSQTEIFLSLYRRQITGITGTKGKSTTSTLLHEMLVAAGKRSILAGNIGRPIFELIPEMDDRTDVVFEMSSHQLQSLRSSPGTAVLLNLFPEHLDHYASYEEYGQAKLNICRWQQEGDVFFYNGENTLLSALVGEVKVPSARVALGRKAEETPFYALFEASDLDLKLPAGTMRLKDLARKCRLPGAHNLFNVAAAAAMAIIKGASLTAVEEALDGFGGLPHRLELVGRVRGVKFYNDSISTVPESTIAALKAFPKTAVLILGGYDRGLDYTELLDFVGKTPIRTVIFIGDAGQRMVEQSHGHPELGNKDCRMSASFEEAFRLAANACRAGEVCMLSPAASSFDSFRDYKERGDRFRELVNRLR